jgi:glycosyltransferase involved in cell wall biosynthesis
LNKNHSFSLYIVGEGFLRKDLEKLIQLYKAETYVKLLGARNDIAALLSQSSCFLMPSLWEGMPISLLEAGACGLPIISTPVGDIPSLIDNSCGYLSLESDFCKTMEHVITNYHEAEEKAACFHNKVITYHSIEVIVRHHEDLYKKVYLNRAKRCAE